MMRRHLALAGAIFGLLGSIQIVGAVNMTENDSPNSKVLLDEQFNAPKIDSRLHWHNPPASSEVRDGWLVVVPGNQTDFWQKTLDGGARDNGHFLYVELTGDFVAEARITGEFHNLYDQAGLMLRTDATQWLKVDAENDPVGSPTLGVVITRNTSDWSVSRLAPKEFLLRIERKGNLVTVYTSEDGRNWSILRMVTLDWKDPLQVGLFAACPTKSGMRARFDYLKITRPGPAEHAGE